MTNASASPPATVAAALAAKVTVVAEKDETVPTACPVVRSYTVMPTASPVGVDVKLSVGLDVDVVAETAPVTAEVKDSMSAFATGVTAFPASVTVVPVLVSTVPTARPVVTSYAIIPAAIPVGVAPKLRVALEVDVAAVTEPVGIAVALIAPE